jgi:tight adherence protein B
MVLALLALVGGLALMLVAGVSQRREEQRALDDVLGMSRTSPDDDADADADELSTLTVRAVDLAGQVVDRMDRRRSLRSVLERAKVPLRPGEFVIVVAGAALAGAAVLLVATHSLLVAAAAGLLAAPLLAAQVLRHRVVRRRRAFEAQLPDALNLVASSLSAGHTFLRAIQMMCQESGPPLSEEFAQVVAETRLGGTVVDAVERMAGRLQIRDMDMVVQAIRIQQSVGGRLADLLRTLADVIRARGEIRREVQVLTAEGRMSAYVLAGLVPFIFMVIRFLNPHYLQPLYHGWGLGLLVGCAASVAVGMAVILRMVRIEV